MTQQEWPSDWMRGVLELAVLRVLADGPSYGYAIAGRLRDAGLGEPKGGTLYPLLTRLEASGDVVPEWRAGDGGPGRKYFAITPAGRERFAHLSEQWRGFSTVTTFITTPSKEQHHV